MEPSEKMRRDDKNVYLMNGSRQCEPSGYLLNQVVNYLKVNQYSISKDLSSCSVILINTCGVTQAKIRESEDLINDSLRYSHIKKIVVFGCLAEIEKRYNGLDKVFYVGPKELDKFNEIFEHKTRIEDTSDHVLDNDLFIPYQSRMTNRDYYVMISQGCIHRCSYCNIKKAKGDISSRSAKDIVSEVGKGAKEGYKEFVLLADDCGSYGRDIGVSLANLISEILDVNKEIKIKISTIFPGDLIRMYPSLKEAIKTSRISYINIPIQSGSERILKLMNRNYDIKKLISIIKEIKEISQKTWLYTHVLFNFPTETREDFLKSMKSALHFDEIMAITYSDNPNTRSCGIRPKVEKKEKETRIRLAKEIVHNHKKGIVVEHDIEEIENPPRIAQLTLTNKCQYNCKHCGVKHLNRKIKEELSLDQIKGVITDLRVSGFSYLDLFGGEPTLRKDIFEIIKFGKLNGLVMLLETNGALLDISYIKKLKEAGTDLVYISLDDFEAGKHDANTGCKGSFKKAIKALNLCRQIGVEAHISMVPREREYFIDSRINRFIEFCLQQGAKKVRILFPSYVGNCSAKSRIFCSEEDEMGLLECIDRKYQDVVYVESEDQSLKSILSGNKIVCPAKRLFCHIASNGLVMPCPYLPLVFGDITKESMLEIFARIQDHPLIKTEGVYCPSREERYLNTVLKDVNKDHPFKYVQSLNKINIMSKCNNNCENCSLGQKEKQKDEILNEIENIDYKYSTISLYGGEIFLHEDILEILDKASKKFKINIYTNGRVFSYAKLAAKLKTYNINAVKIPFFSLGKKKFEKITKAKGSYEQTLKGIRNLCKAGIPVCIYVPKTVSENDLKLFKSLGATSISYYETSDTAPLPDSVLCFGKKIGKTSLIWIKNG